jgi:hypothetical protein
MTVPDVADPCYQPVTRLELPGSPRVRVLEILATGTNGGVQEHVYSLMKRLDRSRYEASVVSLSAGSAVRKLSAVRMAVQQCEYRNQHGTRRHRQACGSQAANLKIEKSGYPVDTHYKKTKHECSVGIGPKHKNRRKPP